MLECSTLLNSNKTETSPAPVGFAMRVAVAFILMFSGSSLGWADQSGNWRFQLFSVAGKAAGAWHDPFITRI